MTSVTGVSSKARSMTRLSFVTLDPVGLGGLTREARDAFLRYDYPGNVRELENGIERAVVLCRGEVIDLEDLPLVVQEKAEGPRPSPPPGSLPAEMEALERRMIEDALARAQGVQTRAAELLGITERALRYKLKRLGFKEPGGVEA